MKAYEVLVLARAARDVDSIFAWLTKRSPVGAVRWADAFKQVKLRLAEDPLRFSLIPEKLRFFHDVRDILFKTRKGKLYRAVFAIVGHEVRILRVRRPGQRPIRSRDLRT
ncbi:MAG TPA: hypothetical protein VFE62_09280 [Gemmataceae bacterium]|nr:hypothetical protein [Gemmataceae bacterium]